MRVRKRHPAEAAPQSIEAYYTGFVVSAAERATHPQCWIDRSDQCCRQAGGCTVAIGSMLVGRMYDAA